MEITAQLDGSLERTVLSAIIFNDVALGAASVAYSQTPFLFRSDLANYVLRYCVEYYNKHGAAPCNAISLLPSELIEKDVTFANRITQLLEMLEEPKTDNSERLVDIAAKYYEKVQIERLSDQIQAKISRDDTDGAIDSITSYKRISTGITTGINPLNDEETVKAVYADVSWKSLLEFSQPDANAFFGDTFSRGSFVVINSPEKGNKSSCILELALKAVYQGRNVAYFEAGDLSRTQLLRRVYERIAQHPRRAGQYRVPTAIQVNDAGDNEYEKDTYVHVSYEQQTFDEDMNADIAIAACRKWKMDISGESDNWRLSCHPQDLTVSRMKQILEEWERQDGFIPDFIVVDYADLLVPEINKEFRHQVSAVWGALRGLSLAKNCCLLTATQSNADGFDAAVMTRRNLAEDKRKAATPTAIFGLNASGHERSQGVSKLNHMVRREGACNEYDFLYMANCLDFWQMMRHCYYPAYRRKVPTPIGEFEQFNPDYILNVGEVDRRRR